MYGYVAECMDKATDDRLDLFFSVFNANTTGSPTTNPDTTAMMPMFCEDSKSTAVIEHSNGYDLESCQSLEQKSTYCCYAGSTNGSNQNSMAPIAS